jgi:hypothetical protein
VIIAADVIDGELEDGCLIGFDHTYGLWPNQYYFCGFISRIIFCLFLIIPW